MRPLAKLFLALLLLLTVAPASVRASTVVAGQVVFLEKDLIVIETLSGFTVAEIYLGHYLVEPGDIVVGELHTFGFEDLYCRRTGQTIRVWVDNFLLSKERAAEWVIKKR